MTLESSDAFLAVLNYIFYVFNISKYEFAIRFLVMGLFQYSLDYMRNSQKFEIKLVCVMMISNVLQYQNMILEFFPQMHLSNSILDPKMHEAGPGFLYYSSKNLLRKFFPI